VRRTPAQHVGRHAHRLLHWLGGIAGVLTLVVVVAIWRLMQGPVELDQLIPYVQQAFARSNTGLGVAVSGVSIALDRDTHQLDLRVQDVRLSLPDGKPLANFPEMATSLSVGALLGGRIEPTRLVVERPILQLTREANGSLSFHVGNSDPESHELGLDNPAELFAPLRPDSPWGRLRQVVVRDATIIVDDRLTGREWRANRVVATLERSEDGVTGDLTLAVELGANAPELHATYRFNAAAQKLDLSLAVDGLDPAALAPLLPELAPLMPLAQAQFPVSGTMAVSLNLAAARAGAARLDLSFGAGQLETALLTGGILPVTRGELHAAYVPESGELRLEKLAFDLDGGTQLQVTGTLGGLMPELIAASTAWPATLDGNLGIVLTHVPTARLDALWPRGVSRGGHRWVAANLSDGVLDELSVQTAVRLDPVARTVQLSSARGTMHFHDLTINYFNGLLPLRKVTGTATLGDRRLDFAVTGGTLKTLKVTGGSVAITELGAPTEWLAIDVNLSGPLQDVLEIIDAKPLHYAHDIGLDPGHVGGHVETLLQFKLPLIDDLKLEAVDYSAKATLSGVALAKIALDRNLSDGNLTLELGRPGVHIQGNAKFDGTAAAIDASLFFHPKTGPRARYRIGLTLDDEARRRLNLDVAPDRLNGPVAVDLTYTAPPTGTRAQIEAALDLRAATLTFAEAGWKKLPQVPGTARAVFDLDNDVVVGLPEIAINAPGLDAKFAVFPSADRKWVERVEIRHLICGENDLAAIVSRRDGDGWRAVIRAARLDLSHAIKRAIADDSPDSATPLAIDAHIARLVVGAHREARDVVAEMLRDRGAWQALKIDGRYANGKKLTLRLDGPGTERKLQFEADDLGASLALFGIADNVVGGHLTIGGTVTEEGGHHIVHAHVKGGDYTIVRAPVAARLLSLASLEGLFSMLSGSGIPFTTLRGDLVYGAGRITLGHMIAYGGALGITANGWLNPGKDQIDLDGTLAPAYTLNAVPGFLPIIGPILMGGEGQGMFAASFRLSGSNDEPTVTVNPLSALTPGLLRRLFDPFFAHTPPTQ
jgi:hypothetical protein